MIRFVRALARVVAGIALLFVIVLPASGQT